MKCIKFVLLFFIMAILATNIVSAKSQPYVKVFYVEGKAEYLKKDATAWKALTINELLYSGDSIKTYKNANVEIAFDRRKKNVVSVRPDTHVVLKLTDREKIELIEGEIFALVKRIPKGSQFEIRTPTAVCGARGTGFGAKADKEKTVVSAYENKSYAKGLDRNGNPMEDDPILPEGWETIVKLFTKPSKPTKISDEDYKRWYSWRDKLIDWLTGRHKKGALGKNLEKILEEKEEIVERGDNDRIKDRLSQRTEEKTETKHESEY